MPDNCIFFNFAAKPLIVLIHSGLKLFPNDKNYILKEVQFDLKETLLKLTVRKVIRNYMAFHNPLGLIDDTIEAMGNYRFSNKHVLDEFYFDLAAIYRYHNCDNQLELIFEGCSQYEKFAAGWETVFKSWIVDFCKYPHFLKAVLGATLFYPGRQGAQLINSRFKLFLSKHFNLKVYKHKGVMEVKSA